MSDEQTEAEELSQAVADAAVNEIEALRAEAAGLKEQVLRFAAEAENTKRRAEREVNDSRAYAITKFARDLLGVADNLARALAATPQNAETVVKNFVIGVEMTEKELQGAFERNGLKRVEPGRGEKFDANFHQAMMEQPAEDVPGGGIVQVLQPGYELFGRIVRPAMVVVAPKTAGESTAPESAQANPYAGGEGDEPGGSVDRKA